MKIKIKMKKIIAKTTSYCLIFFIALIFSYLSNSLTSHAAEDPTRPDYQIKVNRAANCITVYERDENGTFSIPVRAFLCSTGSSTSNTPLGTYATTNYYRWHEMFGGSYTQYAVRVNNHIMFHSIPYNSVNPANMNWRQYNMLGQKASMGCIRLACADAKWIYENCKPSTEVVIYDDAQNPGPLGKPELFKIASDNPKRGWDPTDPDAANPWNSIRPSLYLKNDIGDGTLYIPLYANPEKVKKELGMKNADGIPYDADEYNLSIYGNYDLNKPGIYKIYAVATEPSTGIRADMEIVMYVLENMREKQ